MALAKLGDNVKVHYTGRLEDGTVFDSSVEREPLAFKLGERRLIPGFEEAVVGMDLGETKRTTIEAERAYGPHRDELVAVVPRDNLPDGVEPEVGQELQIRAEEGQVIPARITDVSDAEITVDANHPLAGKQLTFELELVDIA